MTELNNLEVVAGVELTENDRYLDRLRDKFAVAVIGAIVSTTKLTGETRNGSWDRTSEIASKAYKLADEMLRYRRVK